MGGAATALRRRRPRRNTGPLLADPPEGGAPGSGQSEEEQEQEQAEEQKGEEEREEEGEEVPKAHEARGARVPGPGEAGCSLNTCVLLVLLVAVSISVGHSYGKYLQEESPESDYIGTVRTDWHAGNVTEITGGLASMAELESTIRFRALTTCRNADRL